MLRFYDDLPEAAIAAQLGSPLPLPGGGIFDPGSGTWRPLPAEGWLPAPASTPPSARSRLVGVLRKTSATYAYGAGTVLDVEADAWVELPPVDDRQTASITSVGRCLFQFGGARKLNGAPAQLLADAWVWTPPSPVASGATFPPAPSSAPPGTVPAAPLPPTKPPTPGAPQFLSATGDAAAGRVTVRFDRPVVAGSTDTGTNPGNAPKSVLSAMSLIVFGPDSRCSLSQGNAHDYLAGTGTDTITTDATSLAPGTTYIGIAAGFVESAADGTPNDSVQLQGGVPANFTGMSCIPIEVSGTVPTIPPITEAPGGPELLSATGDGAAGRITLRFSRPVVPGDGSSFGRPNAQPTTGVGMSPMQLVVHTTDSTCSSPNGNAHEYLSGVGTDTITSDATSLVVGTTYISISPGFAKAADDGKAMRSVRCLAVKVTG